MKKILVALALCSVTAVAAHENVKNSTVKARMRGMEAVADDMKVLGAMARGSTEFDVQLARETAALLAGRASLIPVMFEVPEDDPESEALSLIWDEFDRFAMMSADLEHQAIDLSRSIDSLEDLQLGVRALGAECRACHGAFRE